MADVHQMALFYQLINPDSALNVGVDHQRPAAKDAFVSAVKKVLSNPVYSGGGDPQPDQIGFGFDVQHFDLGRLGDLWSNGAVNRNPKIVAGALGIYPGGGPCPPYPLDLKVWKKAIP